jgi:glycosyltransferase involved in cell wall biosynthesis
VWSADDGRLGLVVPFVGATTSDYLAAPRRPGLWEVPIDAPLVCWVPMVVARHRRWAPTGIPDELHHGPWRVEAGWQGLGTTGELDPPADAERLGGTCHMAYELRDRSVHVEVQLQLDELPDAVGVAIPEAQHRPLRVEVTEDPAGIAHLDLVDTDGIAEWRSYHGELPVVHQIDLDAARTMSLGLRVTPTIRVASTAHGHHYDRSLYGPLEADRRAVSRPSPLGPLADPTVSLADVDVFHLHWPEWLAFGDLEEHRRIADELEAAGVPVVWTVHNLTPHEKRPEVYDPVYQLWAERAAVAIHHSAWGEARVRDRYRFGPSMRHAVVPHGHFGDLYPTAATPRDEAAARLGLPPAAIRIGVLGAPRVERRVGELLAGLVASANAEVQVCCWSLAPGEEAPTDDRLAVAEVYEMVDPGLYGLRAAACDLLALPFDPDGEMLSTGVAADVVGLGLGALVSDWGYLGEVLGDAGIPVGHTAATIADALDRLTPEAVAAARSAARDRRDALAWSLQAERTFALLDSLL